MNEQKRSETLAVGRSPAFQPAVRVLTVRFFWCSPFDSSNIEERFMHFLSTALSLLLVFPVIEQRHRQQELFFRSCSHAQKDLNGPAAISWQMRARSKPEKARLEWLLLCARARGWKVEQSRHRLLLTPPLPDTTTQLADK